MLRSERDGQVHVLTIDRAERRNAIDHVTILELLDAQDAIRAAGSDVRAVVLTGAPPAFSAGADLTGVEQGVFATALSRMLRGFGGLPVPVIASIDGPALGAGMQLAVAVDLRVATADSVLGIPAAKLGLAVDHWTIRRVIAELTMPVARSMLLVAETLTGDELHRAGAVHRLGGLEVAVEWAHRIAQLAPMTMATHKLGLESAAASLAVDEEFERAFAATWASDEQGEGKAAFLEKRRPEFRGT